MEVDGRLSEEYLVKISRFNSAKERLDEIRDQLNQSEYETITEVLTSSVNQLVSNDVYGIRDEEFERARIKVKNLYKDETIVEIKRLGHRDFTQKLKYDITKDITLQNSFFGLIANYEPEYLRLAIEAILDVKFETLEEFRKEFRKVANKKLFTSHRIMSNPKYAYGSATKVYTEEGKSIAYVHFLALSCQLIALMEYMVNDRVILNLTRMFTLKSTFTTSKDMIMEISKLFMPGSVVLPRFFNLCNCQFSYEQTMLHNHNYNVTDLSSDLNDGVVLSRLIENVQFSKSGKLKTVTGLRLNAENDRLNKIRNIKNVIELAKEWEVIATDLNVNATLIHAGDKKEIISLLLHIFGAQPLFTQEPVEVKRSLNSTRSPFKRPDIKLDMDSTRILQSRDNLFDETVEQSRPLLEVILEECSGRSSIESGSSGERESYIETEMDTGLEGRENEVELQIGTKLEEDKENKIEQEVNTEFEERKENYVGLESEKELEEDTENDIQSERETKFEEGTENNIEAERDTEYEKRNENIVEIKSGTEFEGLKQIEIQLGMDTELEEEKENEFALKSDIELRDGKENNIELERDTEYEERKENVIGLEPDTVLEKETENDFKSGAVTELNEGKEIEPEVDASLEQGNENGFEPVLDTGLGTIKENDIELEMGTSLDEESNQDCELEVGTRLTTIIENDVESEMGTNSFGEGRENEIEPEKETELEEEKGNEVELEAGSVNEEESAVIEEEIKVTYELHRNVPCIEELNMAQYNALDEQANRLEPPISNPNADWDYWATVIQKVWRGYRVRKRNKQRLEELRRNVAQKSAVLQYNVLSHSNFTVLKRITTYIPLLVSDSLYDRLVAVTFMNRIFEYNHQFVNIFVERQGVKAVVDSSTFLLRSAQDVIVQKAVAQLILNIVCYGESGIVQIHATDLAKLLMKNLRKYRPQSGIVDADIKDIFVKTSRSLKLLTDFPSALEVMKKYNISYYLDKVNRIQFRGDALTLQKAVFNLKQCVRLVDTN
ncbi:unnamed protein product [Bursaphelenchus okinawaensis]|uniref:Calponin-homology (CH) domain-containing protein n=1 Tax=Bursaphelenchus okinawaensis TaxID=465554 RepID=A0A811LKC7_9BILA|nr:unnamed protein product [Bursaphelenchus okinawaensis]CAG9125337.1 unnamed protein product [Bursaphelenchus okinawaensis]